MKMKEIMIYEAYTEILDMLLKRDMTAGEGLHALANTIATKKIAFLRKKVPENLVSNEIITNFVVP